MLFEVFIGLLSKWFNNLVKQNLTSTFSNQTNLLFLERWIAQVIKAKCGQTTLNGPSSLGFFILYVFVITQIK